MRRSWLVALFAPLLTLACARSPIVTAHVAPAKSSEPSVRVFSASWCKACHALDRTLTERGISHAMVDIDEQKDAYRAAHDATGSVVLPLTRVQSGGIVGWIEGADADSIAAVVSAKVDARGVIFRWADGFTDYVLVEDGAAVSTSTYVTARTIAAAVRVAAGLRASPTTVARIEFEGDAHPLRSPLAGYENLLVPWNEDRANDLAYSLLLDAAAHADEGHAEARIDRVRVSLAPYERVLVSLHENAGPRWRVTHVHVFEHDADAKFETPLFGENKLRAHVPLADGAWFERAKFVEGLTKIRRDYEEAGYYEVKDDVDYARHLTGPAADIDFVISIVRGPRVFVDRIFVDTSGVEPSLVYAFLPKAGIHQGDPMRPSRFEALKKKLVEAGLATRVEVSTTRSAPGKVYVHLEVYRESAKF
jgi:glutaredoxin